MDYFRWLDEYYYTYQKEVFKPEVRPLMLQMRELALEVNKSKNQLIFAGNGASAAIASHCAVDFTKQAGIRSTTFNDPGVITCFANDYGYEHWIAKAIEHHAIPGDVMVLISSSGRSPNMVNAARYAKENDYRIITFTGFKQDNPLKQFGDLNFWVDNKAYNIVECTHMIWLTTVIDLIVGKAEYSVTEIAKPSLG